MVSITGGPRLPTVSGNTGSLPARVTGPRQNQQHQQSQVVAGRAPVAQHPSNRAGARRLSISTNAASTVLPPAERVRKSMDARGADAQAADPFEQLAADLHALSMQHAAASQQQHVPQHSQQSHHIGAYGRPGSQHLDAGLPPQLQALTDSSSPVSLPPPGALPESALDNWKLDKLVAALGRDKATWRRSLMLFEWLKASRHRMDDRLCTTLIRVCSDHGDCASALAVYDWMMSSPASGGAGLTPTTYTYTAAMRAALAGHLHQRALHIWNDAWRAHEAGRLALDTRLCINYVELCARMGLTDQALGMYAQMLAAPPRSRMAPTVHAFTAAMRAATEGGRWATALDIWEDMRKAGCEPTGHAYAAAISACSAGQDWMRAVAFFEEMAGHGIRPDVVSCTALISALATAGESEKAEAVVMWMLANGVRPNARTYTALLSAQANAKQWPRAVETLERMRLPEWGGVEPNAYTYSALLKSLGEHGQWQLAEAVFSDIERQILGHTCSPLAPPPPAPVNAAAAAFEGVISRRGGSTSASTSNGGAVASYASLSSGSRSFAGSVGDEVSERSWTRPSQLHGLTVDLSGLGTGAASAAAAADDAATGRKSFSLFSHGPSSAAAAANAAAHQLQAAARAASRDPWRATLEDAGASTLSAQLSSAPGPVSPLRLASDVPAPPPPPPPRPSPAAGGPSRGGLSLGPEGNIVNEVVCGALMLAYERAGKWQEAVNVLMRATNLGICPNTVMYNTAISAAGKAGQLEVAEKLYRKVRHPDAVTHETMIAAYGVAGLAEKAEAVLSTMMASGLRPRDYAYCGLIAAHSLSGDWEAALRMRTRMRRAGAQPSVHVYNALLAACERAQQPDSALELLTAMKRDGVEPNAVTHTLLAAIGRQGVQSVESQQVAAAALSAAMAAYGTILVQSTAGLF